MKKFLSIFTLVTLLGLSTINVSANENITSGGKELSIANSEITPMDQVNVGGGVWDYGITIYTVYSSYYHGTASHSATSANNMRSVTSGIIAGGTWAYSSANASLYGNSVYWNRY